MNANEEKLDLVRSMKGVLEKMLTLEDDDENFQYCFKVLIFDDYVFDIICPLLKVIYYYPDLYIKGIQCYTPYEYKRQEGKDFRRYGHLYRSTYRGEF